MVWDLKILSNEKELKGLETPGWPGGNYHIFWTIRCTAPTPQIWEGKGGSSYSPNVAYLACFGGAAVEQGFFFLFSSSKT